MDQARRAWEGIGRPSDCQQPMGESYFFQKNSSQPRDGPPQKSHGLHFVTFDCVAAPVTGKIQDAPPSPSQNDLKSFGFSLVLHAVTAIFQPWLPADASF